MKQKLVALIESDEGLRTTFLMSLREKKLDVETYSLAEEALEAIKETKYDLIIMNPFVNAERDRNSELGRRVIEDEVPSYMGRYFGAGLYLIERARASGSPNKETGIISYCALDLREECMNAGATEYVTLARSDSYKEVEELVDDHLK